MPIECFYRHVSQNKQLFFRYSVPISCSVKVGRRLFLNYECTAYLNISSARSRSREKAF
jgi:hypothetical protein